VLRSRLDQGESDYAFRRLSVTGHRDLAKEDNAMIKKNYLATAMMILPLAFVAFASDASAQGTGGSTGAVASIPGSVVRGHEQQPGLFSILANPPPPGADPVSKPKTIRRGERPLPSK
jgi:hypothetical protein